MTLYTPEDLVQYLYKDTSPLQTAAIENAIIEDWTIREKINVLQSSVNRLDGIIESPRPEVIANVLNYASKTMPERV